MVSTNSLDSSFKTIPPFPMNSPLRKIDFGSFQESGTQHSFD